MVRIVCKINGWDIKIIKEDKGTVLHQMTIISIRFCYFFFCLLMEAIIVNCSFILINLQNKFTCLMFICFSLWSIYWGYHHHRKWIAKNIFNIQLDRQFNEKLRLFSNEIAPDWMEHNEISAKGRILSDIIPQKWDHSFCISSVSLYAH